MRNWKNMLSVFCGAFLFVAAVAFATEGTSPGSVKTNAASHCAKSTQCESTATKDDSMPEKCAMSAPAPSATKTEKCAMGTQASDSAMPEKCAMSAPASDGAMPEKCAMNASDKGTSSCCKK